MPKVILIFIVSLILCSCMAVKSKYVNDAIDIQADRKVSIVLDSDHISIVKINVDGELGEVILKKGSYELVKQNSEGQFFLGQPRCVIRKKEGRYKFTSNGGFFVPFKNEGLMRVWYFPETEEGVNGAGKKIELTDFDRLMGFPKPGVLLSRPLDESLREIVKSQL